VLTALLSQILAQTCNQGIYRHQKRQWYTV
jgi:hypothetical protein